MYRLFTNSGLLSKLGECNIYYISINIYILYLGLENTTSSNQNFIANKKIYTLMFFSGNSGNSGNKLLKSLKCNDICVTKNAEICYHCYHFSFWQSNLTSLYLRGFCGASSVLHNIDDWVVFCLNLRKVISNPSISRNGLSKIQLPVIKKPPGKVVAPLSFYVMFFIF